jgi:FtsH-binding integral membrane protein
METTLFAKTMIILCGQLLIVFGLAFYVLRGAKLAYQNNTKFMGFSFRGAMNLKRELDLIPYVEPKVAYPREMFHPVNENPNVYVINEEKRNEFLKKGYKDCKPSNKFFNALFLPWIILLFSTVFVGAFSVQIGMITFTAQSILLGLILGMIFLEMDENDGIRALKITLLATIFSGFVGYSDIGQALNSSGYVHAFLFFGLLGLIIFEFSRTTFKFSRNTIRAKAFFGIGLFILFLFVDFARLKELSDSSNDWSTAFDIALTLYLDIINLLLEILEAME